jgi:DNA-binding HxlR family transcriptional regulator
VAKRYNQYCPIAHALDLVGERWSLLVVRELMHGPHRYTDLHERLPGCGTNVLAARLKELERGGVVRKRRLPPPAASTVYELTESGAGLRAVLHALAWWGARSLGPPGDEVDLSPGWLPGALHTAVALVAPEGAIEFRVGEEVATIAAGEARAGAAEQPDVVVEADVRGFYHLLVDGDRSGVRIEGDATVLDRLLAALPSAQAPAPALAGS